MKEVTIDNVRERIAELEMVHSHDELSLRGEFELACLRRLVALQERVTELEENDSEQMAELYRRNATIHRLQQQPAPVAHDAEPSFDAMMRALDAFYADDNVPERAMLSAFRILLADVRNHGQEPATDNTAQIGERKGALSTQQTTSLKAYRLAVQCLLSSATSDENATDNTAQQFEALATSAGSGKP